MSICWNISRSECSMILETQSQAYKYQVQVVRGTNQAEVWVWRLYDWWVHANRHLTLNRHYHRLAEEKVHHSCGELLIIPDALLLIAVIKYKPSV